MPYLTPDDMPDDTCYRALLIPNTSEWTALVAGALSELTHAYNFEAFGSVSPDDTAERFLVMLDEFEGCSVPNTDLLIYEERQAQGTHGGSFSSGAWRTRALNTEVVDTASIGSLASNQVTLPAGAYRVRASACAMRVGDNKIRLQDVTHSTTLVMGDNNYSDTSTGDTIKSMLEGRFVLTATSALELQHLCATTVGTFGFGYSQSIAAELYARLVIEKELA